MFNFNWLSGAPKAPAGQPTCSTGPTPEDIKRIQEEKKFRDLMQKGEWPPWRCGGVQPPFSPPIQPPFPPPTWPPFMGPMQPPRGGWICGTGPQGPAAPFGQPQGFSK